MIQAIRQPALQRHQATPATRIEAVRVFGYSSAIALNVIAAGLLLMPLPPPPMDAPSDAPTVWIMPATPPRPVPPLPVEVVPQRAEIPRIAVPTPAIEAPPSPALVEDGAVQRMPVIEIEYAPTGEAPAAGQADAAPAAVRLEYAVAPPPPYPRDQLRLGHEGVVTLQVLVDVDGTPLHVEVAESSGHRALDRAAQRHVLAHWRFNPAMRDGRAVQAIGLVPIEYALD